VGVFSFITPHWEQALQESEEQYRDLYESGPIAYFTVGTNGLVRMVNQRASELLGYSVDELIGRRVLDLYAATPGGKAKAQEAFERFLAGEAFLQEELEMQRADGRTILISLTTHPIRDAKGRVIESRSMVVDITEGKQAEQALQESEERYRSLVELSPDAITVVSEGKIVFANPAEATLMGASSPEELIGKSAIELLHPEDRSTVEERIRRIDEEGEASNVNEGTIVRLDGQVRDIEATGAPIIYQGKKAVQVIARDITDRKRAEEALRESEQRFRILVERAADGFFFRDIEGKFVDVNQAGCEMLGYSRDELLTLSVADMLVEYSEERVANISRQILSGVPITVERTVRRKDGSTFPMELRIGLIEFNGDARIFSVARDLTERKLAEEALRELAVMEERNRIARELHDSATQSLYSLALFAEAALRLADSGDIDGMTDHLRQLGETSQLALKEMRLLVYELRPLALETEGFVGALQQRLDAVEARVGVKTRLLVEQLIDLPSHVEEALYRVTEEALNNTLKHAAASSVEVRIHINAGRLELEVRDNGRGFDPDIASTQGGVGLVGIRERVEELGGTLEITSAPGKGTSITVNLTVP